MPSRTLLPTTPFGWFVTVGFFVLAFLVGVELLNTLFVGYGEEPILFTFQGTLAGIPIAWLSIAMFGTLLMALSAGMPLSFATGALTVIFMYVVGDKYMVNIIPSRIFPMMTDYQLSAIPLFIFMAAMLERAGLIDEMFTVVYKWMGGLRGGLAAATVFASTILAAMVGIVGAAVVTMGMIALPAMLGRKYDPKLALGSVMAGGTLGILIPPSILAIIYAVVAQTSVGELYLGAVLPGLLLSGLYMAYALIRCYINPALGPALPKEERLSFKEKLILLRSMIAPIILIILVLGLIFTGTATPVESAGVGSFGAMAVAALHRRLTFKAVREACFVCLKNSALVLWIMFGASIFVAFYVLQGGGDFVSSMILGTGLSPYGILMLMMVILIFLGMFLDWVGILLLAVPIFVPIVMSLQFDGLFGLAGPQ
ncbi:MAG: TRAP transporter large permease subunit, partial [Rhodospirillales bacterium]|nr:TRAP transporter large permease subunit [Rhodospirillales bacterium]